MFGLQLSKIKKHHYLLILFLISIAAVYFSFLNPFPDTKYYNVYDSATYISEANNLIRYHQYGIFNGDLFIANKAQPPGMAILLTPVIYFFGSNFFAIKLYLIIIGLITVFVSYIFFEIYIPPARALLCMLIFALSPFTFILSRIVFSEIPLVCFFMLALIGFDKLFFEDEYLQGLVLCVVCAACATMLKGTGLALLLVPLPALMALKRKKYWAYYLIFLGIAILPTLWFTVRNFLIESYGIVGKSQFWFLFGTIQSDAPVKTVLSFCGRVLNNIRWHGIYTPLNLVFPVFSLLFLRLKSQQKF